jgi:RHS repeat-associated protein
VAWNRHYYRIKGNRHYELTNHLGNVLAVVTDRKLGQDTTVNATYTPQYYLPDIYSVQNYYAFGQNLPKWSSSALNDPKRYRFGFNGKEDEDEWTKQDYGFRMYDPRVARFLSVDPLAAAYPWYTPYQFAGDMPIWAADLDGLEPDFKGSSAGQTEITSEQGTGDVYAWSWTGSEWRRGLKEVTITSSKKDNGVGFRIPKVEYSDTDYDDYSASSDYSSRDWKTAVNAGVNVANMGIDALRAVVCLPQTIMSVTQKGYQLLSWSLKPVPLKGMDIYAWGGTTLSGINSSLGDPNVGDQVLTFGLLTGMSLPAGGGVAAGLTNPVPSSLARVIPAEINSVTLGAPGVADVFVTAADDIIGLNASQIAQKLTIPQNGAGFRIIEFKTPSVGLASPINRANPGFIGFGRTAGGAREFSLPNQLIPKGSKIRIVR